LATHLERDQDWSCADTDDERQKDTRYVRAVRSSCASQTGAAVIADGGLIHGAATGSFVTGDLCPSRRPLDRKFLEKLQAAEAPVAAAGRACRFPARG